jgi:hypothetical protein
VVRTTSEFSVSAAKLQQLPGHVVAARRSRARLECFSSNSDENHNRRTSTTAVVLGMMPPLTTASVDE